MLDSVQKIRDHLENLFTRPSSVRRNRGGRGRTELLEQRQMLSANFQLVTDINSGLIADGSLPVNFVAVGSTTFFLASTSVASGLWRTDGTLAGTQIVKEFGQQYLGLRSDINVLNGTLYFWANGGNNSTGLWKSDGTTSGTVFVKEMSFVHSGAFTNVSGTLYFAAHDDDNGSELWKSDGTTAGTFMLKDIYDGTHRDFYFDNHSGVPHIRNVPNSSSPGDFTNVGGTLFFTATDGTTGTELWKSDGTVAGTVVVKDVAGGSVEKMQSFPYEEPYAELVPNDSDPEELINIGGTLYFTANDGTAGRELWRSDGTATGTAMVRNIRSGIDGSHPRSLTNVSGILYFSAHDNLYGTELWKSNGTSAGTAMVRNIRSGIRGSYPKSLTNVSGILYFEAHDGVSGSELWKSNGTSAGTALVRNIRPLADDSFPHSLINVGGMLYFAADDGVFGSELWKSNGTAAGTVIVKDINPGNASSNSDHFTNINGILYFSADDGSSGEELFHSNGTAAGTIVLNLEAENGVGSDPAEFANAGGNLYFSANDGTHGRELWRSDGTSNGTTLVRDIRGGSAGSDPRNITGVGDIVYFTADNGINGSELWKTDGTAAGTVMVRSVGSSNLDFSPTHLTNVGGILYFAANNAANGRELWKSDGTFAGTVMVKDIVSGGGSGDPEYLVNHAGMLYFTARGTEIWKSNGTAAGTVLVKDIGSTGTVKVTGPGGLLYFLIDSSGVRGKALWKTDGTSAGTVPISDFYDYTSNTTQELINVSGTLYFTVNDPYDGDELWRSDGTSTGTKMVKDIFPGVTDILYVTYPHSASPRLLTNVNGTLYFVATDSHVDKKSLWKSNGTDLGTVEVIDERTNPTSWIHSVGDRLFASIDSIEHGTELYVSRPLGTSGDDSFTLNYSQVGKKNVVTVFRSTNGGPVSSLGTFSIDAPLSLDGLGGNDSVRVMGTTGDDSITVNSNSVLTVNGASLTLTRIETRTLAGAAGNDVYRLDADTVLGAWALDEAGGGRDTVDFSLTKNVDLSLNLSTAGLQTVHAINLQLTLGSATTIEDVVGGSGADTLSGNGLNNTLTGGPGNDNLIGAAGDDSYLFSPASAAEADQVIENPNEGTDTLSFAGLTTGVMVNLASTSIQPVHLNRTLKLNSAVVLENLIGGAGADTLFGNSLNNTVTGGAGDDKLIGAAGSDSLVGGAHNDTYVFVPATVAEADQVTENLNEGIDTLNFAFLTTNIVLNLGSTSIQPVHLRRTLKLNSSVVFENLIGGAGADTLFGNTLNNTLTGNAGDDKLLGAAGNDLMLGGANNDTYMFVPTSTAEADQVTENTNEGTDTLNFAYLTTSVVLNLGSTSIQTVHTNRTLRLNSLSTFENAVGGTGSDTLLGNALANRLSGGDGNNILVGMEAGDVLESGSGRDILIGGVGPDFLNGGTGDDILIAGRTTNDTSLSNLNTLRTQWISGNAYATRIANLRAGVGSPVVSLKAKTNVLNDTAAVDRLTGGGGTDWYLRALDDLITDLLAGESIDLL